MKIAYIISSLHNSGGTERILTNKVNYLVCRCSYDITIYTTDQKNRSPFFDLSEKVRLVDLAINYKDMDGWGIFRKLIGFLKKQRQCKNKLSGILKEEKYDIVISTFGPEIDWLYKIGDGSRKILELHFSTTFRTQSNRSGLWKLSEYYRTWSDRHKGTKYDRIVTIASGDTKIGSKRGNAIVIPNFTMINPVERSLLVDQRIVAIGRLTYYKGYDRLIEVWSIVASKHPEWNLEIYGSGEQKDVLTTQIQEVRLNNSLQIFDPVKDIERVLLNSSISVLASRHEGFGLVLIEAMACGVPCVAFDCPCGPRDVIDDEVDGFLVEDGDIDRMAERICQLIENSDLRLKLGRKAVEKVAHKFSEEVVMKQWIDLFNTLTNNR